MIRARPAPPRGPPSDSPALKTHRRRHAVARLHLIERYKDFDLAKRFAEGLRGHGHKVTWDVESLVPGEEWKRRLREEVAACDGLVAIFTENSVEEYRVTSDWMAADLGAARAAGKFVIPVIMPGINVPALVEDIYSILLTSADDSDIKRAIGKVDDAANSHMEKRAKESLLLPPGYEHLASAVRRFHDDGPFEQSVFVMMKYPDPATMKPNHCELLGDIWDTVSLTLSAYGLRARRADKKTYHEQIWENVCAYMIGCRYGLAILEDHVAKELNPNVALEYGFMKSLDRRVALVRDVNFKHDRGDLTGKLAKPFEIDGEGGLRKETLTRAIQDWMLDEGVPPRERS